jgi:hypothetical protein
LALSSMPIVAKYKSMVPTQGPIAVQF